MIICADVLDWAAGYEGPRFHALLCDPPYHLTEPVTQKFGTAQRNGGKWKTEDKKRRRGFMGKKWDGGDIAYRPETWAALTEHLHPGAFGMAFASSRGWHRLAVAIEDAGLRIFPSIFCWATGQSFPKATRIDTQIDKMAGAERPDRLNGGHIGISQHGGDGRNQNELENTVPHVVGKGNITAGTPQTKLAATWQGHRYGGQVLKNAIEPIIVFQKPYEGKPVECITATGAGALFIDGGRISTNGEEMSISKADPFHAKDGSQRTWNPTSTGAIERQQHQAGRWPANFALVHHPDCQRVWVERVRFTGGTHKGGFQNSYVGGKVDYEQGQGVETEQVAKNELIAAWECHESCPVRRLNQQAGPSSVTGNRSARSKAATVNGTNWLTDNHRSTEYTDKGAVSRFFFQADWEYERQEMNADNPFAFWGTEEVLDHADPVFYCAKASRKERDAGLEEWAQVVGFNKNTSEWKVDARHPDGGYKNNLSKVRNTHPTVKPIALAKWLATLLLPPPEYAPRRILNPFCGSGSEMIGASLVGWEHITGIDSDPEAVAIAEARLAHWLKEPQQMELI